MTRRHTWFWTLLAAGLFAFIIFYQRYKPTPAGGPPKILPALKASDVTGVIVRPGGQQDIRANRTNGGWQLIEPISYPALTAGIERFLGALEHLTAATCFTSRDLEGRPGADEEYGFAAPQASIILQQGTFPSHLLVGRKTAPGDQVFVQVVGVEAVYVVDADLLKYIPATANDWRDRMLTRLDGLAFDRITVTNGASVVELRRDPTNLLWRMSAPLTSRADNERIGKALGMLGELGVVRFVSDDPKADLESLGFQPPTLTICLGQETNDEAILQFGRSPTNDTLQVYARRLGQNSIVTVSNDMVAPWRTLSVNDWRDPHLLFPMSPVGEIDVRGDDNFSVVLQTNDLWRVFPQGFPADSRLVSNLLSNLSAMRVLFVADVVTTPALPSYGLASPSRQYILKSFSTNDPVGDSTNLFVELDFGTNQENTIRVKRADEPSVYAISTNDFSKLPYAGWQLRERQVWKFAMDDVAGATLRQQGRVCQIIRNGDHNWTIPPGSQGSINDAAVEETLRGLAETPVEAWVGIGDQTRANCGFKDDDIQIIVELKNGTKAFMEFGGQTPSGNPCAVVRLEGQPWVFELSTLLWRDVKEYLSVPRPPGGK